MDAELAALCRNLRLMVFDFDGVMTDNFVYVSDEGKEMVRCSRAEGFGLAALAKSGVELMVLSKEMNPVVGHRCRKLNLPCVQGIDDKLPVLKQMAAERGLQAQQVGYMGNDLNDKECLEWVGLPVLVADAHPSVAGMGRLVSTRNGGDGAVREICDLIAAQREGNV